MGIWVEGFLLQASLILALGAQNLFVLDSGLRRQHHLLVATICFVCDFVLVLIGVLGAASLFIRIPFLKVLFGVLGCGFLLYYGLLKIREAFLPVQQVATAKAAPSVKKTILTALGFSLLNPHVYLDTLVLVGGYAAQFPTVSQRLVFGVGAATSSGVWFYGLALLASFFHRLLHNPKAMQIISFLSGTILLALAVKLGLELVP